MQVYDCFLLFNELELMELRLKTHDSVVSQYVISEARRTYANEPKPLYLQENQRRFAPFLPRVTSIIAEEIVWPEAKGDKLSTAVRMALWFQQQDALMKGLSKADDNDVVLFSDLDELARPESVLEAIELLGQHDYVCLLCDLYYYYFNGFRGHGWCGPLVFKVGTLRASRLSMSETFMLKKNQSMAQLSCAGWHFSYLGGVDRISYKLRSAGHAEYARPPYTDKAYLQKTVDDGLLFQTGKPAIQYVALDETFPAYLVANRKRFESLIRPV